MGKSLVEAVEECELSAWICDYYASNAERFLADEEIEIRDGEGSACIRRSAVGSLLGIMPWNLPFYQVARFAGPNLVLGNTIILKHAPQCPESSAALAELFVDAGFPVGAYVNLYATNEQVAQIIADPRNQGVSVTGSERAGSAVAEIAGRNLKKVVLELGGSDPFILLSTDDMDAAAGAAAGARATNTGQICNAGKRFIVAEGLYDEFVPAFSDKLYATSRSTPLVSVQAAEILADQVAQAVAAGATYTAADAGASMVRFIRRGSSLTSRLTIRSTARSCSGRWPWSSRSDRRRKRYGWQMILRLGSARTCSRLIQSRRSGWLTSSRWAWFSSTGWVSMLLSCRSVGSNALGSVASSAVTGLRSSSTRSLSGWFPDHSSFPPSNRKRFFQSRDPRSWDAP